MVTSQGYRNTDKNCWSGELGSVVIQLYAGECTPSADQALTSNTTKRLNVYVVYNEWCCHNSNTPGKAVCEHFSQVDDGFQSLKLKHIKLSTTLRELEPIVSLQPLKIVSSFLQVFANYEAISIFFSAT